jgi:hypothetical protein
MKHWLWRTSLVLSMVGLTLVASGQRGGRGQADPTLAPASQSDDRLPNGKSQKDEILKAEQEQNLRDAAQLTELAQQLQQDLEKNDRYVVSMATLKKTEDIEKLAKKIRSRMRHN